MCVSLFCYALLCVHSSFEIILGGGGAGCLAIVVFLMYCYYRVSVARPRGAMGWSAVCDCGITWSCSLAFWTLTKHQLNQKRVKLHNIKLKWMLSWTVENYTGTCLAIWSTLTPWVGLGLENQLCLQNHVMFHIKLKRDKSVKTCKKPLNRNIHLWSRGWYKGSNINYICLY